VRVEQRARNRIALFPDAGGHHPATRTIAPHRDALRNPLQTTRLVGAARTAGVDAAPSRNAGAYLCNYVYWRALEAAAAPGGPGFVIFVHVPPIGSKKAPRRLLKRSATRLSKKKRPDRRRTLKRRAPRLDDLVRAGEAIVLGMMSLAAAAATS